MAHRLFVVAVVVLWAGSMSWLLIDKVLPSWYDAQPPIPAGYKPGIPIAWKVSWSGRAVGHAASLRTPGAQGTTNLDSRVVLRDVPVLDLAPPWMRSVVGDIGRLRFEASTHMEFDSLDNFSRFKSTVKVNDIPAVLEMTGKVNGANLELKIRSGELEYSPKVPVPDQSTLREALFPDASMLNLYVGRRWHEETYSPFRAPGDPVETIEAEVTGIESLQDGENTTRVMRVDFRSPPRPGIPEEARLQAIAWVEPTEGIVLQQDVILGNLRLRFERLPDAEAEKVGRSLLSPAPGRGNGWWLVRPGPRRFQTPPETQAPVGPEM